MNSRLDRASLVRHCAFCLTEITGEAIKTCGKCHKRAYCSKACQRVDWSPNKKQKGQGHRTWCGTDYGEEDLNWKISPVPGKGLGIIALQDIPKAYPILVEAPVDKTHPRIADLLPHGGTIDEKYDLNKFGSGEEEDHCFLRMSRINHSCAPNATHFYNTWDKVVIVLALRDIKQYEEICISYMGLDDLRQTTSTPRRVRRNLRDKWGIVCMPNCLCFDKAYWEKIQLGRELEKILDRVELVHSETGAMRLRELENALNLSVIGLRRTPEHGFQIIIKEMNSVTLMIQFVVHELFGLMTKEDDKHQPQGNNRLVKTDGTGQPFCAYRVRVIHG